MSEPDLTTTLEKLAERTRKAEKLNAAMGEEIIRLKEQCLQLTAQRDALTTGRRFRHFKGGEYLLVCIAKDSETQQDVMVYQGKDPQPWVRNRHGFEERFVTQIPCTTPDCEYATGKHTIDEEVERFTELVDRPK